MDLVKKHVALAGTFKLYKHADLKEALEAVGAHLDATVTAKTDFLLCGQKGGAKLKKAQSLNVTVIDEDGLDDFFAPEPQKTPKKAKKAKKATKKPKSKDKAAKAKEAATTSSEKSPESPTGPNPFAGKTIALTGTFATMKRNDAKAMLTKVGAKVTGSVSSRTDYLIFGENAGSKVIKAQNMNVKTIPELEMVTMLNAAGAAGEELAGAEKKLAKQKASSDKKMAGVRKDIAKANEAALKKYGLSLGKRLLCYLKLFAKRKDVVMVYHSLGAPADNKTLLKWHKDVPHDVLAFGADFGSCDFTWVLKEFAKEIEGFSYGYRGGRIKHPGLKNFRWYKRPSDWDWFDYDSDIMFDDVVAEGTAALSYDPGETRLEAKIVHDNANSVTRDYMGDCEDYFTQGAKNAFVWYWQSQSWEGQGFLETIKKNSISPETPQKEILTKLKRKKLSELEAKALMAWLGKDIVLLLPK